jgi:hypothetical protein
MGETAPVRRGFEWLADGFLFRKAAKGWQKVQSIDSDDVDDIEADADGDILVNVNRLNGMLERWRWNGRQFVAAGKLWTFSY